MRPLDEYIKSHLNDYIKEIGEALGGVDTMSIVSPIIPGVDQKVRNVIDMKQEKKSAIAVVLQTPGGVVEIVERMVEVIRNFYTEVSSSDSTRPGNVCRNCFYVECRQNNDGLFFSIGSD